MFDTSILAAHAKGVGTVIMGDINNEAIADIVGLLEGEMVAALIVHGCSDEQPEATPRKSVEEVLRIV